jgi:hypothetical protein
MGIWKRFLKFLWRPHHTWYHSTRIDSIITKKGKHKASPKMSGCQQNWPFVAQKVCMFVVCTMPVMDDGWKITWDSLFSQGLFWESTVGFILMMNTVKYGTILCMSKNNNFGWHGFVQANDPTWHEDDSHTGIECCDISPLLMKKGRIEKELIDLNLTLLKF